MLPSVMSLLSFEDSDDLDSSDVQSDLEPLLQRQEAPTHPRTRELKASSNGQPKAGNAGSPGPAGREYRLTNMAAGTGTIYSLIVGVINYPNPMPL